ncbi:hypothetical protein H112_07298 [Trichophyton rubrum D6]|uniref:Uncharacterized protein n=2 Tax=Trichophyton TaxID=5550 RepID=A0A022VTZ3_TRIRU|nr:hypothetical protein H100_07325 [Trichophyton rubrum MR850]EZF38493.1 hypothetical protein H102_07286 [Trichophyton rubrum CBS 100081]EZF49188.1 hypothetical protein H103_07308 [Trichophyton rubrum CBS 288.86]EZF59833.1 hypothetical protein H104_07261 [Trichophyton rubrum CBS 289.86]EZF70259.1 hypothetical protein H105_07324 [Trichophyton soudanense CBS 452.61]EZF81034.1 hypothetical protein H110_07307 [Trichophyton rubrum MR1448]EZF91874.1 hypothetical protein H113_07360 [Trichophyton rub
MVQEKEEEEKDRKARSYERKKAIQQPVPRSVDLWRAKEVDVTGKTVEMDISSQWVSCEDGE